MFNENKAGRFINLGRSDADVSPTKRTGIRDVIIKLTLLSQKTKNKKKKRTIRNGNFFTVRKQFIFHHYIYSEFFVLIILQTI